MEEEPETLYQTQEPRRWQVGDLLVGRGGRSIILEISGNGGSGSLVKTIAETGLQAEEEYVDLAAGYTFSHNSGLHYRYAGRLAANRDFTEGLFTAYFEIL